MSDQVIFTPQRALSPTIAASSGARARFYETGTTTPITVYADAAGTIPLAQPVVADAAGVFVQVFSSASTAVKAVVTAADDTALFTLDPCVLTPTESGQASQVSVVPFTEVAATNVQSALEQVQANIGNQTANGQTVVQTGGSSGEYTLSAAATITDYAQGQRFIVRPNHSNTGAATLNIDGLGARDVQKYRRTSLVNLGPNDLSVGDVSELVYDGSRFVLVGTSRAPGIEPLASDVVTGATLAQIGMEIPPEFSGFVLDIQGFAPSANGASLEMQLGTGTLGAPAWLVTYQTQFSAVTNGATSGGGGGVSSLSLSITASNDPADTNSSHTRVSGMNVSAPAHMTSVQGGINGGGNLAVVTRYGHHNFNPTRTILRIFPSSGTISGIKYQLYGVRSF